HLEEERGARRVEQDAGRMMAGGRQPEELSVEHVREPGEWVPVGRVGCGERPRDTGPREARPDVHVLGHVFGVVVVDEAVSEDRDEDDEGGQGNHARDGEMPPAEPRRRGRRARLGELRRRRCDVRARLSARPHAIGQPFFVRSRQNRMRNTLTMNSATSLSPSFDSPRLSAKAIGISETFAPFASASWSSLTWKTYPVASSLSTAIWRRPSAL